MAALAMHLPMMNLITSCIFTLIFSFFAAAVVYKVLRGLLSFRAEWNTTFIACLMTVFTCEMAFGTSVIAFDSQAPGFLLKVVGTTALISMIAGTVSCRLIIRGISDLCSYLTAHAFGRDPALCGGRCLIFLGPH